MAGGLIGSKVNKDTYSNIAIAQVTASAANTLTFAQIIFGVGLFQGVALLVHRVNWYPHSTTLRELVAATDALFMALTTSNKLTSIEDVLDPSIIALRSRISVGAATADWDLPLVTDFTSLPGGGKLVPANPMFIAIKQSGAAAAGLIRATMDFTFVSLDSDAYLELLQSMFPVQV